MALCHSWRCPPSVALAEDVSSLQRFLIYCRGLPQAGQPEDSLE